MKIEILVPDSGPAGARNRGDEVDVDTDEAIRLIEAGRAKPVRGEEKATEKAIADRKAERAEKAKAADADKSAETVTAGKGGAGAASAKNDATGGETDEAAADEKADK